MDDRRNPKHPRHRELMLPCCSAGHRFEVKVWFATSSAPRVIATLDTFEAALREARSYLSDARGVWINDEEVR